VDDPEARTVGLGVARNDADAAADIKDIENAAEGTKDAKVMSDDIS